MATLEKYTPGRAGLTIATNADPQPSNSSNDTGRLPHPEGPGSGHLDGNLQHHNRNPTAVADHTLAAAFPAALAATSGSP